MNINLLDVYGSTIVLLAVAVIGFVVTSIYNLLKNVKNEKIKAIVDANDEVIKKVKDVVINTTGKYTQTVVDDLKKQGKWDAKTGKEVFHNAYFEIRQQLGKDTLDILEDIRGNAETYLKNVIENTLREQK